MTTNSGPRVAVVTVNLNGLGLTRACLSALVDSPPTPLDIIVVDNGSTDGSPDRLPEEFPGVRFLLEKENLGFAGGNNVGIRDALARGAEAILLTNNDTVLRPGALERMLARFDARTLVVPSIREAEPPNAPAEWVGRFDTRRGVLEPEPLDQAAPSAREVAMAGAACVLVPRGVFERVGLFDERFFLYYEDTDLFLRARAADFRILYEPAAVVLHVGSASSGGARVSPLTLYYNTRNRLLVMSKHGYMGARFLAWFAATRALYLARYVAGGEWGLAAATLRGTRDFARGRFGRAPYHF